jgi:hypothetical protein
MVNFKSFFWKYHRIVGIIFAIPLLLTAITGIGYIVFDEWLKNEAMGVLMLKLHTMDFFGLKEPYSILVGISLIWLVISALGIMTKKK